MANKFNEFAIQMYLGDPRSGKTLSMVADTYKSVRAFSNTPIYANFPMNKKYFPNFKRIEIKDIENFYKDKTKFKDCYFLFQEVHTFLDSRKFMRKGNQKIGYLLGQAGKRGVVLKCDTHFPNLVDFRLRSYVEKIHFCKKIFLRNDQIEEVINPNKEIKKELQQFLHILVSPIIRKLVGFQFTYVDLVPYLIRAKEFFSYYDTYEMSTPE